MVGCGAGWAETVPEASVYSSLIWSCARGLCHVQLIWDRCTGQPELKTREDHESVFHLQGNRVIVFDKKCYGSPIVEAKSITARFTCIRVLRIYSEHLIAGNIAFSRQYHNPAWIESAIQS
jgi:hypothetical protein